MARFLIAASNPLYVRAARREAKFWDAQMPRAERTETPRSLPQTLQSYLNLYQTGDPKTDLVAWLRARGPFRQALSIGCGIGVVETDLVRHGVVERFTFVDISSRSLAQLAARFRELGVEAETSVQDTNFIRLGKNQYDLIYVANILHHLINLEHVLLELNGALTPDGIIVIDDFIGPDRFQFSDEQLAAINKAGKAAQQQTGIFYRPTSRTSPKTLANSCPFEAIRSSEILPLVHAVFPEKVVESRYGALVKWADTVIDMDAPPATVDAALRVFLQAEQTAKLPPLVLFGVYRKNPRPPQLAVRPWSSAEAKRRLPLSAVNERTLYGLSRRLQRLLPSWLHASLRNAYVLLRR